MAVNGIDVVHEYRIVGTEYVDNGYVVLHDGSSTRRVPLNDLAGFKGTLSVEDIEALTGMVDGDIYAASDGGTLMNGDGTVLLVSVGDMLRWDGTRWELFVRLVDYVSTDKLNDAVRTLTAAINSAFANVLSNLESHKEDYDNPHHVTCTGIGAAEILSLAPAFESRQSANYAWFKGERCTYNNKVYVFLHSHTGAWSSSDVCEDSMALSIGCCNVGVDYTDSSVTDGVLQITRNNSLHTLTTALSTVIIELVVDAAKYQIPNFAVQIVNSVGLELYVRFRLINTGGADIVGYLSVAEASGNQLAAVGTGEGWQVTCVGGCWTCAKFVPCEPPSA